MLSHEQVSEASIANIIYEKRRSAKNPAAAAERLRMLEQTISEHLATGKFFVVAAALRCIEEEKLYSPQKNIYVYGKMRFRFSRRTTNTYLCSSYVYESITEDKTLPVPNNISHVRSLHKYSPEVRRYIWRLVCDSGMTYTEENVVAMTIKYETGVAFSDLSNELYTPSNILNAAKAVIGAQKFDMDPASSAFANTLHNPCIAQTIFTEHDDGLAQQWHGNVWLCPPFGSDEAGLVRQQRWFEVAQYKYQSGEIASCHLLLRVNLNSSWFSNVLKYPHCFFHDRITFLTPTGREKTHQESYMLAYMGPNVHKFCEMFLEIGSVPGANSWSFVNHESGADPTNFGSASSTSLTQPILKTSFLSQSGQSGASPLDTSLPEITQSPLSGSDAFHPRKRTIEFSEFDTAATVPIKSNQRQRRRATRQTDTHQFLKPLNTSMVSSSSMLSPMPASAPAAQQSIIPQIQDASNIMARTISCQSQASPLGPDDQSRLFEFMNQAMPNMCLNIQNQPSMSIPSEAMLMHNQQIASQMIHLQSHVKNISTQQMFQNFYQTQHQQNQTNQSIQFNAACQMSPSDSMQYSPLSGLKIVTNHLHGDGNQNQHIHLQSLEAHSMSPMPLIHQNSLTPQSSSPSIAMPNMGTSSVPNTHDSSHLMNFDVSEICMSSMFDPSLVVVGASTPNDAIASESHIISSSMSPSIQNHTQFALSDIASTASATANSVKSSKNVSTTSASVASTLSRSEEMSQLLTLPNQSSSMPSN